MTPESIIFIVAPIISLYCSGDVYVVRAPYHILGYEIDGNVYINKDIEPKELVHTALHERSHCRLNNMSPRKRRLVLERVKRSGYKYYDNDPTEEYCERRAMIEYRDYLPKQ